MDSTYAPVSNAGGLLSVRLFGHADVSAAGVPVKFAKRSTTLAMLAFLVLKRGQSVSRESLAFTLFPDEDEAAALAELRRYLYLANKALPPPPGDPWLIVDAETVRWNEAAGALVDVVEFERLGADERTRARAIEFYTGELLEDIYDDWVITERERLRSRYLAILSESIERHRARREFAPAIECAKRLLATDPWREDAFRSLLASRYESGDTAGALADYEAFTKRLRDELAIAPMPETVAVRRAILSGEAIPGSFERPIRTESEVVARPNASLPFVGREREFAALQAAWSRAARGAGGFVVVGGEAGVGKTRLLAEFARNVQAEGGRVFVGTTAAPESTPYQAIVEALRSALPLLLARPPAPARRAVLARLVPELRDPAAAAVVSPESTTERETAAIYDALSHALRSLASPRPMLLVLEDLHWGGSAGIEALGAIVRELTNAPVLIVATARDEETPLEHPLRAMQRSLRSFAHVEEIALDRLAEGDVAELVGRVDGLRRQDDSVVRDLYAQSEGNALFLSEVIGAALERSSVPEDASGAPPASLTFASIIAARVARLSAEARAVAEVAAVAGAGCSVPVIREVSNLPATSVARGFDELLDCRILREAGARATYAYAFTHHLIGEAIYGEIEPAFCAQRHARLARVLEASYREGEGASSREIARHYERGGDAERAAGWYLSAARGSAAVYAYGDAIELASHALELAESLDLRTALHDVREKARGRRGDRPGQREDIDALERLAGDAPQPRFDVLLRRVFLARTLGESDEEGRLIAELDAVAEELGAEARAQALLQRASHFGLRSRPAEGLAPARAALEIFERVDDSRGQLDCLSLLVDFATNLGDIDASRGYLAQMHARVSSLADRAVEARALAVASTAALGRQEYRTCFELTAQGLAINLETGDREAEAASRGRLAVTAAWLFEFGTALREFELAMETYESIGHKRGLAVTHTNRTVLLMRLGLFEEALDSIERSNAYFETVHEQRLMVANGVNASFVNLQLGDAVAAKSLAETALVAAKEIGFPVFKAAAMQNLGNAERALGDYEAALEHMTTGIALRRPVQDPRDFADDLGDLTLTYAAAGRAEEALATARELEAIGKKSFDGSFWPQYAWWAIAQGFAAGNDAAAAAEAAARARAELERFADRIDDAHARRAFTNIPVNQRIAAS